MSTETKISELHATPKRPFVELLIASSTGTVLNTITSENPELAKLLSRLAEVAEANGFPIEKVAPLMALSQDIYKVDRALVLFLLGAMYSKPWKEILEMPKNFPETAVYTFIISY